MLNAWFCPFAQRTWLALLEKGIQFNLFEVSLKDPKTGLWHQLEEKPEWFLRISPLGKVPALAYEEDGTLHNIYESSICNEFLEDYAPPPEAPALLPPHPATRAHARIVIDRFQTKFVPVFYRLLIRQDKDSQDDCTAQLTSELLWLESMIDPAGPYFAGEVFSLIDCALLPHFLRMYILKHYRGFELPARCSRLNAWYANATKRPAVQKTLKAPEGTEYEAALLEHYSKYANATANSTSAKDFK